MKKAQTPEAAQGYVLAIDGATPAAGVALATLEGRLVGHFWCERPRSLSQYLMADLARLIEQTQTPREAIRAVGVTLGPGSFTSLRVGLALAKTLAHGWKIPLYGFSTLEMLARRWPAAGAVVCGALDARRGEVYSGVYRIAAANEQPVALRADRVETIEDLLTDLAAAPWPLIEFSGNGALKYREQIVNALGERAGWVPPPLDVPSADVLALACAQAHAAGREPVNPLSAAPLYLRVSDAQRRHKIMIPSLEDAS